MCKKFGKPNGDLSINGINSLVIVAIAVNRPFAGGVTSQNVRLKNYTFF